MRMSDKNGSNSFLTMVSYGVGRFLAEFLTGAYGVMVYYFFETELKVMGIFVSLATVIYSVWNALNDPLIGYSTGKDSRITRRFGNRTPWILLGLVLCSAAFCLIFSVPKGFLKDDPDQFAMFAWMVICVCLYDFLYSLWEVNYQGVFPDKFREGPERTRAARIATFIGVFGIALGSVLPPLFYKYGQPETFARSAVIVGAVGLAGSLLIFRGVRETPEMIERYRKKLDEERDNKGPGFFESVVSTLKHREFLALAVCLFLYQSACMCMTGSVNYVAHGVLGATDGSMTTPIFAGMLIGALISIFLWGAIAKRNGNNNQRMMILTLFCMAVPSALMVFADTQLGFAAGMFAWGIGFGGCWTFIAPAMADVVDAVVVREQKRDDGVLMGVRAFFMRLSYSVQALVFWLCHKFTGYDPSVVGRQETDLAVFGIKLHMTIVPALLFAAAAVVFMVLNPLTPEKVSENRAKLKELDL